MALSILYCGGCDAILAAAPELDLSASCVAHDVGTGDPHAGYQALRLLDVDAAALNLGNLAELARQYPKGAHAARLEPLAGCCG
jgi:hypothetical protein